MSAVVTRHVVVDDTDGEQVTYAIYVQDDRIRIEWTNREADAESITGTELTFSFDQTHLTLQMEEQWPYETSDRQISVPRFAHGLDQLPPLQNFLNDNPGLQLQSSSVARPSALRQTTHPDYGGFVYGVVSHPLLSEYRVHTGSTPGQTVPV